MLLSLHERLIRGAEPNGRGRAGGDLLKYGGWVDWKPYFPPIDRCIAWYAQGVVHREDLNYERLDLGPDLVRLLRKAEDDNKIIILVAKVVSSAIWAHLLDSVGLPRRKTLTQNLCLMRRDLRQANQGADSKSSVFTEQRLSLGPKWPFVTGLLGLPIIGGLPIGGGPR